MKSLLTFAWLTLASSLAFGSALVSVRTTPVHGTCGQPIIVALPSGDARSTRVTGSQSLELDERQRWTLTANAAGCWSEELEIAPSSGVSPTIRLWPTAQLLIDLPLEAHEEALHGVVTSAPGATTEFRGSIACKWRKDKYACVIPAGVPIDLRFDVAGYAPLYSFDLASMRGETLHLAFKPVRGASISGSVQTADGRPVSDAAIQLVPNAPGTPDQRLPLRTLATKTNKRGFFQIRGVEQGEYSLVSRATGMSEAQGEPVQIRNNREYSVPALVQRALQQLTVWITPPVDLSGKQWRLSLEQQVQHSGFVRTVADRAALVTGEWRLGGFNAGEYWLVVQDSNGNRQEEQRVTLLSGDEHLNVMIHSVSVRGHVHAGDEEVAGTVTFRKPGHTVKSDTDSHGTFVTVLPSDGKWSVNVMSKDRRNSVRRDLSIVSSEVDAEGYVRADIELPKGTANGRVVDRKGEPMQKVVVFALCGGHECGQSAVDEEGRFRVIGLEPGTVVLQALRIGGGQSDPVPVAVGESTNDVTLTFNPLRNVRGIVTTPSGSPIAGAILRFFAPTFSRGFEVVSGPGGRFTADLPETEAPVTAVVLSGIYAVRILSMPSASLDDEISIAVGNDSGVLRINLPSAPPWPTVSTSGTSAPLTALFYPADGSLGRREFGGRGIQIDIESGTYTICRTAVECRIVSIPRGGEGMANFVGEEQHAKK